MANLVGALRGEITRLSKKVVRDETAIMQKMSVQYRRAIADLKRRIAELEKKVGIIEKPLLGKPVAEQAPAVEVESLRFSAKGLAKLRKRLGLTAREFGKLIGVSDQSVYNWEFGRARPMVTQLAAIAAARAMGKREARARIEKLG